MNTVLDKKKIARSFSRASSTYEKAAIIQKAVLEEHLDRLKFTRIEPHRILDLGSGTGIGSEQLQKRYRKSNVVAIDIAQGMLQAHQKKLSRFANRTKLCCADLDKLPLAENSVDLIFSNLALQWSNDIEGALREILRVLRTGGLLSFTTVGPDTLKELRDAWSKVDNEVHIHDFMDMHVIGDMLIRQGFGAPVLDVDRYTLTYPDIHTLVHDLKRLGATNASTHRPKAVPDRNILKKLEMVYVTQDDGKLPLTYEIIYAHAWVPEKTMRPQDGSTVSRFPVAGIKRRT